MVAVKRTIVVSPPLPPRPWKPEKYTKEPFAYSTPDKGFSRFREFAARVHDCTTASQLRSIVDVWWTRIYDGHPPPSASFNDICLYIGYELVHRDAFEFDTKLTDKFIQNYQATRLLFTDKQKARELLLDRSTTYYLAEKSGNLLSQCFSATEEVQMAVVRRTPPPLRTGPPLRVPTAPAQPAVKPPPRLSRPPASVKPNASELATELLLKKMYTDEELFGIIAKEFPHKKPHRVTANIRYARSDLNAGRRDGLGAGEKIKRFYRTADGALTTDKPHT